MKAERQEGVEGSKTAVVYCSGSCQDDMVGKLKDLVAGIADTATMHL